MDELPADYVPEERGHPPWLMDEMVAAEPSLVAPILSATGPAAAIAGLVRTAVERQEPVAVVGCGTSETAAMAVSDLLREALGRVPNANARVQPRQALEAALDAWGSGLCLAISHEGGTRATILAMEAARESGAQTALITARGEASAVPAAKQVLVTPRIDRSWCHTVGYVSPILAGAAIAQSLRPPPADAGALERLMMDTLGRRGQAAEVAERLGRLDRLVVAGAGPDRSPAKELALKIEEGARLPARMLELETLLHGHLAACDARTGLVLLATGGEDRALRRARLVLQAAREIGMATAVIVSPAADATLDRSMTDAGRIVLPPAVGNAGLVGRFCAAALGLQLLTLQFARVRGTNPDLIRREQAPYREAARIAEADRNW